MWEIALTKVSRIDFFKKAVHHYKNSQFSEKMDVRRDQLANNMSQSPMCEKVLNVGIREIK